MVRYTAVKLVYRHGFCNHRLRFGVPCLTKKIDAGTSYLIFKPHNIFGYIRWSRNNFGTDNWQFFVLKTHSSGRVLSIPGVYPGADILFRARGKVATKRALSWLDRLEKCLPFTLSNIPESYWRLAHNAALTSRPLPIFSAICVEQP